MKITLNIYTTYTVRYLNVLSCTKSSDCCVSKILLSTYIIEANIKYVIKRNDF